MSTIGNDGETIECKELHEVWFEHMDGYPDLQLMTWNLAAIEGSDHILGTEIEDLVGGIMLNKQDFENLKSLVDFILITHDFDEGYK